MKSERNLKIVKLPQHPGIGNITRLLSIKSDKPLCLLSCLSSKFINNFVHFLKDTKIRQLIGF